MPKMWKDIIDGAFMLKSLLPGAINQLNIHSTSLKPLDKIALSIEHRSPFISENKRFRNALTWVSKQLPDFNRSSRTTALNLMEAMIAGVDRDKG